MNKLELITILHENKVPHQMYSLDGLKDGECICILNENSIWKVVYMERGRIIDIASEISEDEAYDVLYNEFKRMFRWA